MGSREVAHEKPHAVCIPAPGQSHIKAMLKLAKLLHHNGFHITFVNTESNHNLHRQADLGQNSSTNNQNLPANFQFRTISDGLPPSSTQQDTSSRVDSITTKMLLPFLKLLRKLNDESTAATSSNFSTPPVTHIVSDGFMPFTITAGDELGIPVILFFTISASVFMSNKHLHALMEKLDLPPAKGS